MSEDDFEDGFAAAQRARDEAMERVHAAAPEEHKRALQEAVEAVARRQPVLCTDDFWDELERRNPDLVIEEKRVLGSVLRVAESENIIRPTGRTGPSRRRSRHAGKVSYYVSCLHPEAMAHENDLPGVLLLQLASANKRIAELEQEVAELRGPV